MSYPIDLVILTWNDGPSLSRALKSALRSEGVDLRITVVDNGSQPAADVSSFPAVELIRSETNLGVAAGRNRGAFTGESQLLCFLDSDARLDPQTLQMLASALLGDKSIAMAAPVFTGQKPNASAGKLPGLGRKLARGLGLSTVYAAMPGQTSGMKSWDVEFAIGACQLYRREVFEAESGFNEAYFYGPEDIEMCARLRKQGWRIVQVETPCEHPPRRRHRNIFTPAGARHAFALLRYLWHKKSGSLGL